MGATSLTRRMLARIDLRNWAWWELPGFLRFYVGVVPVIALGLIAYAGSRTTWHLEDLTKFLVLVAGGLVAVAATPRTAYAQGVLVRDFISAWVLPVAILLPPVYAMVTPVPLLLLTQWRIHRGVIFRRVFTGAAMGLAYGGASLLFRVFPVSFAGPAIGSGRHAVTWALAVMVCEIVGGRGHNSMIMAAIKISDPKIRLADQELTREALQGDLTEFNLGVLTTVVVAVTPAFAVFAVPLWLMVRRYMMHAQLLAQSRIDTKTGLLNASTWESEAQTEITRAVRTNGLVSVALIDIDHFKVVNDTHGHLVGDVVLRAVTDAIQEHLRSYDLAGRFGGEEFVVLLPHAGEREAVRIAERLRSRISAMAIPAGEGSDVMVRLTISIGVAALDEHARELNDLMSAADAALYQAKQSGRNRTRVGRACGEVFAARLGPEEDLREVPPAAATTSTSGAAANK